MGHAADTLERVRERLKHGEYSARHELLFLKSTDLLEELARAWSSLAYNEKSFFLLQLEADEVKTIRERLGATAVEQQPANVRRLFQMADLELTPARRMFTRLALEETRPSPEIEARAVSLAIEEARNCIPEDNKLRPKVGASVFKGSQILGTAYRGKYKEGEHAEYELIDYLRGLRVDMRGATLVTTLEPCTTRGHDKFPCAGHIYNAGIARVVVGTLDPNPKILGKGVLYLQARGIQVDLFTEHAYRQVVLGNGAFLKGFMAKYTVELMRED